MLYTEHALYHWRCVYFFVAKSLRWWVELDRQKSRNWLISSITTLASYFFLNKSLVIRKWNPLFLYWNLHTGNIYIYSYTCTVHKNTCTHTCPRTLTNWCWFLFFRVLIYSVNHEFIRETADRLSIISLLKWCSNMYKNFLYKIICIWFTTQAFTIIISVCQWTKETGDPVPRPGLQTKISNSEIIPTFILKQTQKAIFC